jgi:NitT/TauT family transport system permease protein
MQAEASAAPELAGLDVHDQPAEAAPPVLRRAWKATWPKLAAGALAVLVWQAVVSVGIWPDYLLPGPGPVLQKLAQDAADPGFWFAVLITLERALGGYLLAVAIGLTLGVVVAQTPLLRTAVGSMITGLQSMPSIAWFPLAILLFGLSEGAIVFVVLIGAAPAVANGVIGGIDQVSPLLVRCGRAMGATRVQLYRHVVLPAAVPSLLGGLKQAWAFAWRSLMAGELLVIIANRPSLGVRLEQARELSDAQALLAAMVVVFLIGMLVDALFSVAGRSVNRRWGLAG